MPIDAREIASKATEKFAARHPATWKAIQRRIDDPLALIVETLERDEAYRALLAQTEQELNVAVIIETITRIALGLLERFLGAL